MPEHIAAWQPKLQHWASLIASGRADGFNETALLPEFLSDIFCGLLGYTGPAGVPAPGAPASGTAPVEPKPPGRRPALPASGGQSPDAPAYTLSRERHVEVDGEVADAALGRFGKDKEQFIALLEGKGTRDPLERPFGGRRMSAVDQAYRYAINQRVLTRLCRENGAVTPPEILRCTQKLLDRVLFCAFCEDRGLLPAEALKHAFEHRDPYNPHPLWHNFRGLFRAIDEGNAGLNIPAYNGGLFALDPALDAPRVPDEVCAHFKELGDYHYRPGARRGRRRRGHRGAFGHKRGQQVPSVLCENS